MCDKHICCDSCAISATLEHFKFCNDTSCGCYPLKIKTRQVSKDNVDFGMYLINRAKFEKIVDDGMRTDSREG